MRMKRSARTTVLLLSAIGFGCQSGFMRPSSEASKTYGTPEVLTIAPGEGMWVYNNLPSERLRQIFSFETSKAWSDNLQMASVKIGASGAFVSPDGLILTNHHVAAGGLQNASAAGKDYITSGFLAKSLSEEIKLPGLELSVLESIKDVTDRVNDAVDAKLTGEAAMKARNAIISKIESESEAETKLQSNVVTLFGGARYDLYRYKRYTDIRCAFAPEMAVAFFGGDPDNFEYPRYDLDITLLRAYEDGKPANVKHYLRLSTQGVRDGDLVFISGNPGTTDRLLPVAALKSMRDLTLPLALQSLERSERVLLAYSERGPEEKRQAQRELFGIQNSLKALRPRLAALKTDLMDRKQREETGLRAQLRLRPTLAHYDDAWDAVASAEAREKSLLLPYSFIESGRAVSSPLFGYARTLVRLAAEDAKPDSQRLPEYTNAKRGPLTHRLEAEVPSYPDLEIAKITDSLKFFQQKMPAGATSRPGAKASLFQLVLAGKSPEDRAKELVNETKLADVNERKRLMHGGAKEIADSKDPMIVLARSLDNQARAVRRQFESEVDEPLTQSLTQINKARFGLFGDRLYPDATGTLRLSFGVVRGYEQDGTQIPPWTTLGGAFEDEQKHDAAYPYQLPESWKKAHDKLKLDTPLNFVSTADITNGNSGSPVVNRSGDLVGILFDSNRQGVADNFAYTDVQARAVSVDSRAVIEALKNVYGATALLDELLGQTRVSNTEMKTATPPATSETK